MKIRPPALKHGDTIGVMATSCWLEESDVLAAKSYIESLGYKIYIHPQTLCRHHQSAGTASEKIDALHDLYRNKNIRAIIGARGGNRAITMMNGIDYDLIINNPKIFMGYSDMTILLNGIFARTGMITYHGPLFRELPKRKEMPQILSILSGKEKTIVLTGANIFRSGDAEGTLIGGNLSVFQTLLGTPNLPDMRNAILFIEDVGDHLSRYDRMLGHLKMAGILNKISGLIVGSFTEVEDDKDRPFGFTMEDIIREHTAGLDIPILMNAPFGHGDDLPVFPVGAHVRLSGTTLTLLDTYLS
ncbi:MAG: LD-carboxypeptidase [Alphaproteobacteria bacterium]|nr:LD-carboxypeptidase [Alphaproteobacteria bacterium]